MFSKSLRIAFLLGLAPAATAATMSLTFSVGSALEDGTGSGLVSSQTVGAPLTSLTDISVTLNGTTTWLGDLYAHLQFGGHLAVLLNRVGMTAAAPDASSASGFSLTLSDAAATDVHAATVGAGAFQPDGRLVDPFNSLDTAARTALLNGFLGANPNGIWTLYMEDVSPGDEASLTSWTLNLTGVGTLTWDGGSGANSSGSAAENWVNDSQLGNGDSVIFAGAANTAPQFNLPNTTQLNQITFAAGAAPFLIGGATLHIGGQVTNLSSNLQTLSLPLQSSAGYQFQTNGAGGDITVSGSLGGSAGLAKSGLGTLTVSGNNTFTGGVVLSQGVLALNSPGVAILTDGNTATHADIEINGGALSLMASEQVGDTGSISLTAGSLLATGSNATETLHRLAVSGGSVATGGNALLLNSAISLSGGSVMVNDSGLLSSKWWNITGGSLLVEPGGSAGVAAGSGDVGLVFGGNASSIDLASSNSMAGGLLLQQDITIDSTISGAAAIRSTGSGSNAGWLDLGNGARTITVFDGPDPVDFTISAQISNGGVTKAGSGALRVSGPNTYAGPTSLNMGTLLLGANNALSAASPLTIGAGTRLETGGYSSASGPLSLGGSAVLDFGSGSGSILTFSDVGSWAGVLAVWNYSSGGSHWTAGVDKLIFSQNTPGMDLSSVQFYSDSGMTPIGVGAGFLGSELVPVPEAGGAALGCLLVMGLFGKQLRKLRRLR